MASISADQRNMENRYTQAMSNVTRAALSGNGSPEDSVEFNQLVQEALGINYSVTTSAQYSHNLNAKVIDAMP